MMVVKPVIVVLNIQAHPVSHSHHSSTHIDSSFRRLESGENSGEIVNRCCIREAKFLTLDQGIEGGEIRLDVGFCKQECSKKTPRPVKREEFDKFLKKYPNMDPIQIFLTLQNQQIGTDLNSEFLINQTSEINLSNHRQSSSSSCLSAVCQPTTLRRHKHFSTSGHTQEIDVIDTCDCITSPEICQRGSKLLKLHQGTPYEDTIDVGECVGPCGHTGTINSGESSCKVVRNRTVTVDGPNGSQCFPIVAECQCVGNCYRTREFHKIYDYALIFENSSKRDNNSAEILATEGEIESSTEPLVKVIDVGKCEGSCRVNQGSTKCLIWSERNETCLSSLYGGHSHCAPTKLTSHFYIDRSGQSHSLISVTACGCR